MLQPSMPVIIVYFVEVQIRCLRANALYFTVDDSSDELKSGLSRKKLTIQFFLAHLCLCTTFSKMP